MSKKYQRAKSFCMAVSAATLVTTGIITNPLTVDRHQISASASVNVDISINSIVNLARSFWSNYYAADWLQVYYAGYTPSQVATIKRQYGTSANSAFHQGCKSTFYSWQRAQAWQRAIVDPFGWFFFVHREENGSVNCYMRVRRR